MNAKIDKVSEMEKVLNVNDATNAELMSLSGRFGLGDLLRHLSLEKLDGVSAMTLILSLCLLRINGTSIFSTYKSHFQGRGRQDRQSPLLHPTIRLLRNPVSQLNM